MLHELRLIHPEAEMCEAFRRRFEGLPNVRVVRQTFEELEPCDCFVTAGNAFGIMTAGIDAALSRRFGPELMRRVQGQIRTAYLGEQPIGTAFLVETDDADLPFVAHAPTMRVPGSIEGTDKVYTAAWGAFLAIAAHNSGRPQRPIGSVAFPAFGTGFGGVACDEAARQMATAYRHFLHPPTVLDWETVALRQREIFYDHGRQVAR